MESFHSGGTDRDMPLVLEEKSYDRKGKAKMNPDRRQILKSLGTIAASSAFSGSKMSAESPEETDQSAARRPNILVFLTDDHGQWLQQAYGNSEVRTPNMNRIASNGVRMTNAFTPCPVCSPARASFFTGRTPSQHGIHDWLEETNVSYAYPWLQGQTLLPQLLKKAGYHTGLVGKWHCGQDRHPRPGFDSWFCYWNNQYPHFGPQLFSDNGKQVVENGFQSPFFTDEALKFLRNHYDNAATASTPFFLFVGYTDTHSPHVQMPDELVALYENVTFRDIHKESFPPAHGVAISPVSETADIERTKHKEYYAAATSVDREVGKILSELESLGHLGDTLVVYTGDHGLNAGQHGMWEKGNATVPQNFLEESIRIACAISWPGGGISRNLESDLLVNHCDLFATLLDAADAAPDEKTAEAINSPGRSYLSQLRGLASHEWRDHIICEYGNARMIRKNGYKLILRYPFDGIQFGNEFYDLKADPRETTNLWDEANTRYGPIVKEMSDELDVFFLQFSIPGHSGLELEKQPTFAPSSPWLKAVVEKAKKSS
jgi:choline-sulfatase